MADTEGVRWRPRADAIRRWSLLRSSIVVGILALALAGTASALLITTATSLGSAQRTENERLAPAQGGLATLLGNYLDQETGVRAYVLDGQAFFLAPYHAAEVSIPRTQDRLTRELSDNPEATAGLGAVVAAYQAWSSTFAAPQVARVAHGQLTSAQSMEESGQGLTLFNVIRDRVATLDGTLARARQANEHRIALLQNRLEMTLVVTLVLIVAAIGLTLYVVLRRVVRPLRGLAQAARRVADGRLHAQVPVAGPGEMRDLSADLTAMRYRLLEEINRARLAGEALRHDSPTVSALHDALIPRQDGHPELVAVGRLDPAEGVLAGDWYDLMRIGDALAVVVGDVSGHGAHSAVLALRLRSVITTRLMGGDGPGEALAAAAANIADGVAEHFATVFVALIEPGANQLRYASAGHPSALLATDDGGSAELGPTGPFVSPIVAHWSWSTLVAPFGAGDRLLVYTDGVTEGRNATKEEYGAERLKADLISTRPGRPADTIHVIADQVDRFVGASQSDDRTLVFCMNATREPSGLPR